MYQAWQVQNLTQAGKNARHFLWERTVQYDIIMSKHLQSFVIHHNKKDGGLLVRYISESDAISARSTMQAVIAGAEDLCA